MGLGQWRSLEKISLHSFVTSIPPGFDLMNNLKRKKLAPKHEVNEGIHMGRGAAQICLLHDFYLPSCLFTYVSDIDEHAE